MVLDLYKNIGKLFYAIAKADGQLALGEYLKLNTLLKDNWCHINPKFIEAIIDSFNQLYRENADSSLCFDDFIAFYQTNPDLFSKELKRLILKTANGVAYAFAKINKSELILLGKLNIEFKK